MSSTPYIPLDPESHHIRLLRILPGPADSQICCTLEIFDLHHSGDDSCNSGSSVIAANEHPVPDYVALSYTWGEATTHHQVALNGIIVLVRSNLWYFLQTARQWLEDRPTYLWIDSLCINQSNNEERGHQVGSMAHIYRQAKEVIIWLGPASQTSDLAMEAIGSSKLSSLSPGTSLHNDPLVHQAIRELCERSYWSRLWVLQELVHARSAVIMCGDKRLPLGDLDRVLSEAYWAHAFKRSPVGGPSLLRKNPAFAMLKQIKSRATALFDLILSTNHLGCAETRDKVFALLSIAASGHNSIQPDYDSSVQDLMNAVLRNQYLLQPPTTVVLVKHTCRALSDAFGVEATFDKPENMVGSTNTMARYPLLLEGEISFWWPLLYQHKVPRAFWTEHSAWERAAESLIFAVLVRDVTACCLLLFGCTWQDYRKSSKPPWTFGSTTMNTIVLREPVAKGTAIQELDWLFKTWSLDSGPLDPISSCAERSSPEHETPVDIECYHVALFGSLISKCKGVGITPTLLLSAGPPYKTGESFLLFPSAVFAEYNDKPQMTYQILEIIQSVHRQEVADLFSLLILSCMVVQKGATPRQFISRACSRVGDRLDITGISQNADRDTTIVWAYKSSVRMMLGQLSNLGPRVVVDEALGLTSISGSLEPWKRVLEKISACCDANPPPENVQQVKDMYCSVYQLAGEAMQLLATHASEVIKKYGFDEEGKAIGRPNSVYGFGNHKLLRKLRF